MIKHEQQCGEQDITSLSLSNESHLNWNFFFHKNPLHFRTYADFEAVNEIDISNIGIKTTNIYKQNPVLNGYRNISELDDVPQNGYHKSPLGYNNIDWFADEVIKSENKMAFFYKNIWKDIIMREENEKDYKNNIICQFYEQILNLIKLDHCHSTGKNRGLAHNTCNINVTQKQSVFKPLIFHKFSNYDCHTFFKSFVDKKNDKVKFDIIPNTKEDYISATYGYIRFIDSYRIFSSSLDSIVKTLVDNSTKTLKNLKT